MPKTMGALDSMLFEHCDEGLHAALEGSEAQPGKHGDPSFNIVTRS